MLEFVQKTLIRYDGTADFDVKMDKSYTVDLFIDEILSTRPNEYGYIGIFRPGISYVFGDPNCRYRSGELIDERFPNDILYKTIKEVRADGGYSRMDYIIKLED